MDRKTVEHIANLARVSVTPEEAASYAEQMTKVLASFQELSSVETNGVEPLLTPSPVAFRTREDIEKPGMGAEGILQNAPERMGNLYVVPNVV
jgi:aspartyl-tRNA(Asn)/glutamyl-tRNA(Gln) amidotransferase subunit C